MSSYRKRWILVLCIFTLVAASVFSVKYLDEDIMKIQVLTDKKAEKIFAEFTRIEDSEKLLANQVMLSFNNEVLAYDGESNTFFLPLSMENDEWENGSFLTTDKSVTPFFLYDFTKDNKNSLMAANDVIEVYLVGKSSYYVTNLKITGVSIMNFEMDDAVLADGTPLFKLRVYDSEGHSQQEREFVKECYSASTHRGNTSLNYEKKSLRLHLYEENNGIIESANRNLLGMRDDNDWILNALYADASKIKDKLANDLWNQVGAYNNPYKKNFGSDIEYVEVFINNSYYGLYGLMYPIDKKQLGMESVSSQLKKGEDIVERIYKKKYSAAWSESDFIGELVDPNMPDYRGGFFLKGDTILSDESEWEPLRRLAECIESDDEVFSADITELVDQENVLDNWLFYQAIGGFDNYAKNVYYIARNRNGNYFGYFIPWDLNLSFGDVYADNKYYCETNHSVVRELITWEPAQRMIDLDVNNTGLLLKQKWEKWREGAFSEQSIYNAIDELEHIVKDSGAFKREQIRWPGGRYEEDFSDMKEFTKQRLDYVDEYVEGLSVKRISKLAP